MCLPCLLVIVTGVDVISVALIVRRCLTVLLLVLLLLLLFLLLKSSVARTSAL